MALRHLKIPITEAPPLLRGLVQHVLSPCRYSVAINQLDCLQALRDKTLYVRRQIMTTQEVLYAEVKPDISTVATPLFEVSERCLCDRGNFLPHAAVLTAEGKVELVGAAPDSKDGYADSTQVLPLLHDGLRAMAKRSHSWQSGSPRM